MREDGRRPVDAIDHSESKTVYVNVSRSPIDTSIMISDKGEGIFKRIRRLKEFSSEHEAILELSKGKLTICLLYTSPSPRDATLSRMPSSA